MTEEEKREKKFEEQRERERQRALPPSITREERTITALEKIANGIFELDRTLMKIYIDGAG